MNTELLKKKILDLAIRGKLVEQRPEEGTAEDLYLQIQEEKANLIKEGKLKKEKPLAPIENDDIPFDLPESWKWVRIRDISLLVTKGTTPRGGNVAYTDKGVGFLRAENVNGLTTLNLSNLKFVSEKAHQNELKRSVLEDGDILVTIAGTLGRTAVVQSTDLPLNANQAISIVRMIFKSENMLKYAAFALNANTIQQILLRQTKQTAIPNLTLEIVGNCIIPLPPLAEQKRIVEKIDLLFSKLHTVEDGLVEIDKLSDLTKKKILDLAIRGKLVKQRPEEGTAEDLYLQIQEEKANLIKEGKLKKEKPLAPIENDDIPFDLPESWKWVRIRDISLLVTKGTTPRGGNVAYTDKGVGFLRAENVNGLTTLNLSNLKFVSEKAHQNELKRSVLEDGDILVTIAGTLGRTAVVQSTDLPLNANQAISIVRMIFKSENMLKYAAFALNANTIQQILLRQTKQTAIPNLTLEIVGNCIIPLPPLAEQKRIVAKVEELLALCDKLKLK